jgi:archaetidylinositol phosphate synthase
MQTSDFRPAERVNRGLVSVIEQKVLLALAGNLPPAVRPDHLTALGFGALLAVGFSYWYARYSTLGLWLVILFLALNWFGDSLDGTLARVRGTQRPRYGFYVDHVLDACGSVFLFAGLALSGYMSERIAVGLLVAYFLVSIEVYLATYAVGRFHLSFAAFGPTELRLLLIAGNIAVLRTPYATFGSTKFLLFDVGGALGIVGMGLALVWSIVKHAGQLYRAERVT